MLTIRIRHHTGRMGSPVLFVDVKYRRQWCTLRGILYTIRPQEPHKLKQEFAWYAMEINQNSRAHHARYIAEVAWARGWFERLHRAARALAMGAKPKSAQDRYILEVFAQHPDVKAAYLKPYDADKQGH